MELVILIKEKIRRERHKKDLRSKFYQMMEEREKEYAENKYAENKKAHLLSSSLVNEQKKELRY